MIPNTTTRTPPKRLRVLLALQRLLEGICVADGDLYDLAGKVFVNRALLGADVSDHPPALAIIEAPRNDFATFAGENAFNRADKWTLFIQGIVSDDKTADTEQLPFYLCQDVEKRLTRISAVKESGTPQYKDAYLLGDMISSVEVAPPIIRPPEAGVSSHAFFYLPIRLGLAVEIGQ
jgi:hypothetical protein